jgi:hypothetical protein
MQTTPPKLNPFHLLTQSQSEYAAALPPPSKAGNFLTRSPPSHPPPQMIHVHKISDKVCFLLLLSFQRCDPWLTAPSRPLRVCRVRFITERRRARSGTGAGREGHTGEREEGWEEGTQGVQAREAGINRSSRPFDRELFRKSIRRASESPSIRRWEYDLIRRRDGWRVGRKGPWPASSSPTSTQLEQPNLPSSSTFRSRCHHHAPQLPLHLEPHYDQLHCRRIR